MGNNTCPRCQFFGCNALGVVAVPIDRRGGGNAYLCMEHARGNRLLPYSSENHVRIGSPKKNGETVSYEFEVDEPTPKAICELGVAGFMGSHNCTVDLEAKSPIYEGFCAAKAILPQLERLQNNGELCVSRRCGTHLHIGRKDYGERQRDALLPYYWTIHSKLWLAMDADKDKTKRIFGRSESEWAFGAESAEAWRDKALVLNPSYATTRALDAHPAYLNIQHEQTLEWRQCKFVTASQYSECIDLCRKLSAVIFDFAAEAAAVGGQHTAAMQTKAARVGDKLAKIFKEW